MKKNANDIFETGMSNDETIKAEEHFNTLTKPFGIGLANIVAGALIIPRAACLAVAPPFAAGAALLGFAPLLLKKIYRVFNKNKMREQETFKNTKIGRSYMPEENLNKYFLDILKWEQKTGEYDNYQQLISSASILFETGLRHILVEPAHPIASEIIEAHLQHNPLFDPSVLIRWQENRTRICLGQSGFVLAGLKHGLCQKRVRINKFLDDHFQSQYRSIITKRSMYGALNKIVNCYRNPTSHGDKLFFSKSDYVDLLKLILGYDSCTIWAGLNSFSILQPDRGILHNHIVLRIYN